MDMVVVPYRLAAMKADFVTLQLKPSLKVWFDKDLANCGLGSKQISKIPCPFFVETIVCLFTLRNNFS